MSLGIKEKMFFSINSPQLRATRPASRSSPRHTPQGPAPGSALDSRPARTAWSLSWNRPPPPGWPVCLGLVNPAMRALDPSQVTCQVGPGLRTSFTTRECVPPGKSESGYNLRIQLHSGLASAPYLHPVVGTSVPKGGSRAPWRVGNVRCWF